MLRLAGLHPTSVEAVLLGRGIRPENIAETRLVMQLSGAPFSAEEMVDSTFTAKPEYLTPFSWSVWQWRLAGVLRCFGHGDLRR